MKVVDELRYYPKASARHLVTHRSNLIGIFYWSVDGAGLRQSFITHVLDSFKTTVGEFGYDILLFSNSQPPFDGYSLLERVKNRDVDGVLLFGIPKETTQGLIDAEIPIVGVDYVVPGRWVGTVTSDNRRAIYDLIRVLYDNGYRRIGFAHGPLAFPVAMERLQGYYSGMAAVGLVPDPRWIVDGAFNVEGGRLAASQILRSGGLPEILICSSDFTAIGALQVLQGAGVSIPDDIGIIGFDDVDGASYVYPQLTTISQKKTEIGRRAGEIMVSLIDRKNSLTPMHYVLPTELVVRQSTRPLSVRI